MMMLITNETLELTVTTEQEAPLIDQYINLSSRNFSDLTHTYIHILHTYTPPSLFPPPPPPPPPPRFKKGNSQRKTCKSYVGDISEKHRVPREHETCVLPGTEK